MLSSSYQLSPLMYGGLEITCKVIAKTLLMVRNKEQMYIFSELLENLYTASKYLEILRSIMSDHAIFEEAGKFSVTPGQKKKKNGQ